MTFSVATKDGHEFECRGGETILEAALRNAIYLEHSCKTGRCGSCRTKLVCGDVTAPAVQSGLSKSEAEEGFILTCVASPASNISISAENLEELRDCPPMTLPCKVDSVAKLNDTIVELVLRLPPQNKFKFVEGQYLDLVNPEGVRRSYSIASGSDEAKVKLIIKNVERGEFSDYLFNRAKVNDLMRLEGPKGSFIVRSGEAPIVFFATGTGIAPLMAMLARMRREESTARPINVYWGNDRFENEFFELPEYRGVRFELIRTLARPEGPWRGDSGFVQDVFAKRQPDLKAADIYACGSELMIAAVREKFEGREGFRVYWDAFLKS